MRTLLIPRCLLLGGASDASLEEHLQRLKDLSIDVQVAEVVLRGASASDQSLWLHECTSEVALEGLLRTHSTA